MIIFVLKQVVTCCLPDLLIAEALQSAARLGRLSWILPRVHILPNLTQKIIPAKIAWNKITEFLILAPLFTLKQAMSLKYFSRAILKLSSL